MGKRSSRGSAERTRVETAKRRLIDASGDRPWLMALGIGKVDGELGLIVSVKPSAKPAATRVINRLHLDVPVEIRGVGQIRARAKAKAGSASKHSVEALRKLAAKRLG